MSYHEVIRESIQNIERISEDDLERVADGELSHLAVYFSPETKIFLEKNPYRSSPSIQVMERNNGGSFYIHTVPRYSGSYKNQLHWYFEELTLFSEVSSSIGYTQSRLILSSRETDEGPFELRLIDTKYVRVSHLEKHRKFIYSSRDELVRGIVRFESQFLTLDTLSRMPQELRDKIVGARL